MRKLLLLVLLLLPAQLAAQQDRASLTLFSGVRVPFTTGDVTFFSTTGEPVLMAQQQRGGTPVLGAEASYRLFGRLSAVVAGAYSRSGTVDYVVTPDTGSIYPVSTLVDHPGGSMLFGRAGLALHFEAPRSAEDGRVRPSTDLSASAATVRELGDWHPAINVGFKGSFPLARGVDLALGLEDYLVFWRRDRLESALGDRFSGEPVRLYYDTSNIPMIRLGVTLHH